MYSIFSMIVYAILSFAIVVYTRMITNKKILQLISDNDIADDIQPYEICKKNIIICILIVIVSGICGYIVSNNTVSLIANIKIGSCYLAILAASIVDYKTNTIPNFVPLAIVFIRVILLIFEIFFSDNVINEIISSVIGCFLSALLLFLSNKISHGGIGGGDIKLLAAIGLMCGVYVVFSTLVLSLIVCAIFTVILLISKKKTFKDHMPFGPFVFIGFLIMCLFSLY